MVFSLVLTCAQSCLVAHGSSRPGSSPPCGLREEASGGGRFLYIFWRAACRAAYGRCAEMTLKAARVPLYWRGWPEGGPPPPAGGPRPRPAAHIRRPG